MNCSPLIRWISSLCEVPTGCKPVASKRKQLFCGAGGLGYGDATARPFFLRAGHGLYLETEASSRGVAIRGEWSADRGNVVAKRLVMRGADTISRATCGQTDCASCRIHL